MKKLKKKKKVRMKEQILKSDIINLKAIKRSKKERKNVSICNFLTVEDAGECDEGICTRVCETL
jgi:hypothetical protein